mgnify:CR=1 FL=1
MDLFNYSRRESSEVNIGATPLGGNNPIRIQSMTNTVTMDTEACVEQAKRIIDAGGEYVRLTTQGVREAENLKNINIGLRSQGYDTPLVADVHFNPKVADVAAQYAEKVRINPGNYVDPGRRICARNRKDTCPLHSFSKYLQGKPHRHPHRGKPRFSVRPHHVSLW